MTGKEKKETPKQEKKTQSRPKGKAEHKAKSNAGDREKTKMAEKIKALEEKAKEFHDKYLRLSAEFDNYRKRTLKEKTELIKTASEDVIKNIIPIIDDIERGIQAVNNAQDVKSLKEGMNLIYGRLSDFLQQNGVKEIEAMHTDFDSDFHDAVTKIPATEENLKGKVVDVIQKGYMLHEKVIRYPKVVVGE